MKDQLPRNLRAAAVLSASVLSLGCGSEEPFDPVTPPPSEREPRVGTVVEPESAAPGEAESAGYSPGVPAADTVDSATSRDEAPAAAAAVAEIEGIDGSEARGMVAFAQQEGALEIAVRLAGLTPGAHGFHIHETGDCGGAGAAAAGPHFSPTSHAHGAPDDPPSDSHAGDLGNIVADADGEVQGVIEDEQLELHGQYGIVGRAVIVHEHRDDLSTQPSGDSGSPVACGVITLPAAGE